MGSTSLENRMHPSFIGGLNQAMEYGLWVAPPPPSKISATEW